MAGGRRAILLTAITTAAIAVGTTMVLLALCVAPAMQARADRTAWMDVPYTSSGGRADGVASGPTTMVATGRDHFQLKRIDVVRVAASGTNAPLPPGVSTMPRPGEAFLSPAMVTLSKTNPALAARYGPVRGTIADSALAGPDALVVIRGVDRRVAEVSGGFPVDRFRTSGEVLELTGMVRLLLLLGSVAMIVPIAFFVAIATRLSAASRDRRLAALRLAGATTTQVSRLAATESLLPGLLGAVTGVGLLLAVRPLASYVTYDDGRWFAADLNPGPVGVLLTVVGVPLVTALSTQLSMRGLMTSPLGVARKMSGRPVRAWRVLPLLISVVLLGPMLRASSGSTGIVIAAFTMLLGSLLIAGPWVTRALGLLLARSGRPAHLLAGRRLADDPRAGFRSVAGVVLAILSTTLFVATTPAAAETLRSTKIVGQQEGSAQASVFYSPPSESRALLTHVAAVDGITDATLVYEGQLSTETGSVTTWIGDCGKIVRAAQIPSVPCGRTPIIVAAHQSAITSALKNGVELQSLWPAQVAAPTEPPHNPQDGIATLRAAVASTMPAQVGVDMPEVIVAAGQLGPKLGKLRPTLMLFRYRDNDALGRARTLVVQANSGGQVSTQQTSYEGYNNDVRRLYRVVALAALGVFFVAGCSLLVALAVGLLERRRPFGLLRAAGTPLSTLRETVLIEAAVPLISMSAIATLLGALVAKWVITVGGRADPLPYAQIARPVAAGVLISLTVVVCALPLVRRLTDSEETRFE